MSICKFVYVQNRGPNIEFNDHHYFKPNVGIIAETSFIMLVGPLSIEPGT